MAEPIEDLKKLVDVGAQALTEGYFNTPLREFTGVFEDYEAVRDEKQGDRVKLQLSFSELDDVKSVEPYAFPIAQLPPFNFSTVKKSQNGFLVASIDKLISGGKLSSMLKRRVRMRLVPENFGKFNRGDTEDRIINCWEFVEIIGGTTAATITISPIDVAIKLAVGKPANDLKAFYQEAFKNNIIKGDKELLSKILNKTFIQEMVDIGALVTDAKGILAISEE